MGRMGVVQEPPGASERVGGLGWQGGLGDGFPVVALVDTAGCDMEEARDPDGASTLNSGEARVRAVPLRLSP